MKKLFLLILLVGSMFVVTNVSAKSYNFGGYYCDPKQDQGDGTFKLTCHIVATTDFEVNHIEGTLILKNVVLKDIKTSSDWVSNNGLSSNVSFKSATSHKGSFAIADLTFTGNLSDKECEASFMPNIVDKETDNYVCAIVDDKFYGKDGAVVTEEKYYEDCCNYVCTIVDNKYYFDNNGKSVTYDKFMDACSSTTIVESPQTGVNYGYIILPLGIISIIGIIRFSKKNSKIYKI